jgi:hypothetical protein
MSFPILCAQNSTPDRRSMLFSGDKNLEKNPKKSEKIQAGAAMRLAVAQCAVPWRLERSGSS